LTPLSAAQVSAAQVGVGGAALVVANLDGAALTDAHLVSAYLHFANLSGADLSSTQLRGADLSSAHLRDAQLSGARLEDAMSHPGTAGSRMRQRREACSRFEADVPRQALPKATREMSAARGSITLSDLRGKLTTVPFRRVAVAGFFIRPRP
jgi:uncharacterized protein YjbI with pentapeptide repeats